MILNERQTMIRDMRGAQLRPARYQVVRAVVW